MKSKLLYVFILLVFFTSCSESFLDLQNPNQQTEGSFWKIEADLQSAITAVYHPMDDRFNGYYGEFVNFQKDCERTPDLWGGPMHEHYNYTSSSNMGSNVWASNYQGIFYANQVIQYGEAMEVDQDIKDKYIPEAYFLRGLYYYFLVNDFGPVPLRTKIPATKEEGTIGCSTMEEIWQQIILDFTTAAAKLPQTRPSSEAGRATRGAALAFLGRSYLYNGDWAKAEETLKSIVDNRLSYQYKLQENFAELFDGDHENMVEQGGGEGVFEIGIANVGGSDVWTEGNNKLFTSCQAILWAPGVAGGWEAGLWPTQWILDDFLKEPTADGGIDPRAEASMAWDHFATDPDYTFYQKNYHDTWGDADWTEDGIIYPKYYNKKYANWWLSAETMNSTLDLYAMRYSDVLLMLAEAYAQQDKLTEAAPLLKQIRDRAHLAEKDFTATKEVMMAEIRHQRHLEFFFEGSYFYDLRRWGLIQQVVNEAKQRGYQRYTSKFEYWPIPQTELDANPNIYQNEAWR